MIQHYEDIYPIYLEKSTETLSGLTDAVVLKTDAWNEVRLDIPGTGAIIGKVPNVKTWYCVEKMEKRSSPLREMYRSVNVITGELQRISLPENLFDGIICLGTINYMSYPSAGITLSSFAKWLKSNGRLYLVVWLFNGKNQLTDSSNEDHRFYHNGDSFPMLITDAGFTITEEEDIVNENNLNGQRLVGYKCMKGKL